MERKPKGFGYVEFGTLDGLKKALELNGTQFQGRNIRISVADPRKYYTMKNLRLLVANKHQQRIVLNTASWMTGPGKAPCPTFLALRAEYPTGVTGVATGILTMQDPMPAVPVANADGLLSRVMARFATSTTGRGRDLCLLSHHLDLVPCPKEAGSADLMHLSESVRCHRLGAKAVPKMAPGPLAVSSRSGHRLSVNLPRQSLTTNGGRR